MAEQTRETSDDPWAPWRTRLAASRKRREDRVAEWQQNVVARTGTPHVASDATRLTTTPRRITVNQDWPLTKAKTAQLYSQTPEVRLSPRYPQLAQAVPAFGRELNDTIADVSVGTTVEEVVVDVVNASGISGVLVSCERRTEPRQVPTIDPAMLPPDQQAAVQAGAMTIPTTTVDVPVDVLYRADRISPADLLIPSDFTGSNYDLARWLGEDGRMPWPQAQANLHLTDDVKDQVLGKDARTRTGKTLTPDTTTFTDTDVVNYTQLFYWRHYYHADETNFRALQRLVFVEGLEDPVINEPYAGQKRGTDGRMLGVTKNPIRVLTLTYISDDALPPSDSSISRGQVEELEASRDGMVQQRKHSIPIRWFDSNRVSPGTRSLLEKGTFQGFIPTNGPGDRAVGEVARASFPTERYEFDRVIKSDISEQWQVGTNQAGAFASGERSASEAKIVQANFQTRVGQERDKVTKFFLGIAEVLAGHLALYGTFDMPDDVGVAREALATGFTYSVRADSTVRMDAQQRIDQLEKMINYLAQSPYANVKPLVEEYVELNGMDPTKVVVDPQPKPPDPVKVSVSKAEDLNDPLMLATLSRTHQLPLPEDVSAVDKLLKALASMGLGIAPLTPVMPPATGVGGNGQPPQDGQTPGMVNADWQAAPRLDKRDEDGGA